MTAPRLIRSVLVANRGEIAVRVLREARAHGLRAIAVYSDPDAHALHVREADEAVHIGPAPAGESYLSIPAILDAARRTGADAVHPGYGFLSENAGFARAVIEAGIVWIGPPPEAITAMGDKARAKALMIEAGVPTVPGWQGEDQSTDSLKAEAGRVGYPLLIKASAGGGGRGMREARSPKDFEAALASARREARSAFGDDAVLLEKLIEHGRHVEIQVFADSHGGVIHLGERDCSAQRRRQKVIEEAPSPAVDADLRARMGADAVRVARAVNYLGAGTVEFLLDSEGNYYFLEMNTRLQVEHPVTEMITGLNLVALQFDIAAGAPLPLTQEDVVFEGAAVEARLYAEDPLDGFAPQSGQVLAFDVEAAGVRIDTGFEAGDEVGTAYDPMLAKVIALGEDRDAAINRLVAGLKAAPLLGVRTNRDFLIRLLESDGFQAGAVTTGDLDQWAEEASGPFEPEPVHIEAAALASALFAAAPDGVVRSGSVRAFDLVLDVDNAALAARVEQTGPYSVRVQTGEAEHDVVLHDVAAGELRFSLDGVMRRAGFAEDSGMIWLAIDQRIVHVRETSPWGAGAHADPSRVTAPVAGAVAAVHVKPGDQVEAGQVLAVMEAMKMEMRLVAQAPGVIRAVHAAPGSQAPGGFVLIELDVETQD